MNKEKLIQEIKKVKKESNKLRQEIKELQQKTLTNIECIDNELIAQRNLLGQFVVYRNVTDDKEKCALMDKEFNEPKQQEIRFQRQRDIFDSVEEMIASEQFDVSLTDDDIIYMEEVK